MIEAARFVFIGWLLQGALGRDWAIRMPQSIEALSGYCVLIPCTFEIPAEFDKDLTAETYGIWKKHTYVGDTVFDSSRTETSGEQNEIKGRFVGKLARKNCTMIMDRFPPSYNDTYFFRLEAVKPLKYSYCSGVEIHARDSPPEPKITTEVVEVLEGTSVNLSCSAAAPCPDLPPNLSWTPRLGDSVDQLQENEDRTKSASSVLTFTASHLHHGKKITCRALYTRLQGDTQKTTEASLILGVQYVPQISGSGSCSRSAEEISCSCESRGNPSPSLEWHVSGLRVTNSTDGVIREEQLGNTGLRSFLTVRQSQGDTPTLLCISTNALGNSSLQLRLTSPRQCSGFGVSSLLICVAVGAGAMTLTYLIVRAVQKQGSKREAHTSSRGREDTKACAPPAAEDAIYANHTMVTARSTGPPLGGTHPRTPPGSKGQNRVELDALNYASIKHSPRPAGTQGQHAFDGATGGGPEVIYSEVKKSKAKRGKDMGEG